MPVIRIELQSFVETWNNHYIRKQPKRPNSIPGRPQYLYRYPPDSAVDHKQPVDFDALESIARGVAGYGWCSVRQLISSSALTGSRSG
jgi:hypothetical protein